MDPAAGAVQMFAHELRRLRRRAGSPTYRAMARHTRCSAPAFSAAAAGERLPSLPVALAHAAARGGEAAHREERRRAAAAVCPRSRGGLSKDEWQAHLPDVGYRTIG
ncbi:hypothetical protein ACFVYE_07475 [Streptomyces sp. NPDC058239]|uniref:hypothetical protein n=1 Tax=unclassified Streptomyces TaxID=2593676 RepID=UPI00365DBE8A